MSEYGFFVNYELKDAEFKYGFKQMGIFAAENLKKGQPIFRCNPATCVYLQYHEIDKALTREELLQLCKQYPESEDFIHRYSFMPDDDAFDFPKTFREQNLTENCMFFNHSCDGNCGFASEDCGLVVAKKDIQSGEELTYDYQLMDIEPTFYDGLNCRCGTHKCRGVLRFNHYRNVDWINENYRYSGNLVQKRIDELKTKWFSASCYVKKYNNKTELGLAALKKIAKNELVGSFSDLNNINPEAHYFRYSDNPTCYLIEDGGVYALDDLEPSTELTIKFNK